MMSEYLLAPPAQEGANERKKTRILIHLRHISNGALYCHRWYVSAIILSKSMAISVIINYVQNGSLTDKIALISFLVN